MTRYHLKLNILAVVAYIVLLIALAALSFYLQRCKSLFEFIKEMSSFLLALPAAYLPYCFQQRQAHLALLRDLWKEANEAKGELIQYTFIEAPRPDDFARAHRSISKAIDSVRSVYRNVNESDHCIGFYPFEPLHDMRKALEKLLPVSFSPKEVRSREREKIITGWNAFRWAFLREFQASDAPHPITERGARDPRREGRRAREI